MIGREEKAVGGQTLFDKVWDSHVVHRHDDGSVLLHIDRHVFARFELALRLRGFAAHGRALRNPELTIATADHMLLTKPGRTDSTYMPAAEWIYQAGLEP